MYKQFKYKVLALSGGVGGAKLAHGLTNVLPPGQLMILANTGDDFTHLGLRICPDLDTVMYTLAGIANQTTLWGIEGETWHFMDALSAYTDATWFNLGDRDLATHVVRTMMLNQGQSLSAITLFLARKLGIEHTVLPMSDATVETRVVTAEGEFPFQEYFVKLQCRPAVTGFHFRGSAQARANPAVIEFLKDPDLGGIIICPSNPFVSVDPILSVPGIKSAIKAAGVPVVAVTPIIGGRAVKGPAAKMMQELRMPVTATGVAQYYRGLIDAFVLDTVDAAAAGEITAMGIKVLATATIMSGLDDKIRLAGEVLMFLDNLKQNEGLSD
jgi:LPPG:FO 2-phospho-L-lactate transferase